MTEWIISSGILILIIILLRRLLRGRISLRLQYALWGIVLLRLLTPFSLFDSGISVMNAVEDIQSVELARTAEEISGIAADIEDIEFVPDPGFSVSPSDNVEIVSQPGRIDGYYAGDSDHQFPTTIMQDSSTEEFQLLQKTMKAREVLVPLWLAGAALMLCVFFASNLRFAGTLRRTRREIDAKGSIIPVYVCAELETPCLFGFFRPAVYLTPECENDLGTKRHVLAHETTHYRHGDNIWAVLRCVCLALHWYNPLVWWAAVLSKRDAELACDEGAIKRLGEAERSPYGRTLIGLTCQRGDLSALALTATTMTGSQKSIKERIILIAKKPRMGVLSFWAVILAAALAVGCTFSGANTRLSDEEFISMAYEDAQSTAFTHSVSIGENGVLTREGDSSGKFVVVRFPVLEPVEKSSDMVVVTYAITDENSGGKEEPYSAVVEYLSTSSKAETPELDSFNDVKIAAIIDDKVPTYAIEAARDYVFHRAQEYENRAVEISEAKLTGLTSISTGAATNDFGILMYLVEYRLLPEDPDRVSSVAYTDMEDGWITEYGYAGQPYIMLVTGENGVFSGLCMYTDTHALENDYSTPGMIAKYGSKYTAACMESYYALIGEENYSYYVMMQTGGVGIPPYYHLKYERVWTENGWLMADGKKFDLRDVTYPGGVSISDEPNTLADYTELAIYCNPLVTMGKMEVYTEAGELLRLAVEDVDDLYLLDPGSYYVVFDITVPGRYIAEEDMREETGYTCAFPLDVTSTPLNVFYFTGDTDSLVELYAREIHAREMLSVEGDYAITDYKLLDCEVYAERVDGGAVVGQMVYAFSPVNTNLPNWWAGNTSMGEGEAEGMLVCYRQFTLESRGGGYWECTGLGTGGAGGWGYVWNWTPEEALSAALNVLEEPDTDKTYLLWSLPLINFADMDIDDFFDLMDAVEEVCVGEGIVYGPEDWRTWEQVYPDDQLYRNLYCMRGALNTDGGFSARMQYIIHKIYNHDPELFERCLQYFSEEEQEHLRGAADDDFV